ncbi:hypothetical protein KIN20_029003 [Parelaphostrongylus tenuis]|uniref:Skp1-related protein n=1 Tax=Parelaphostrongylus tenuis TaxID=148309 RepID=A0AAD5R1Q6_PARTN|nr:hypothetical protein KIN20_029003 [Parelaphostrongylus tenuis]
MDSARAAVITLVTNDGENFVVPLNVIRFSRTINATVQGLSFGNDLNDPIPVRDVSGPIMRKVLQWCTYHINDPQLSGDLDRHENRIVDVSSWDAVFLNVESKTLFEIVLAADYLDIKGLLNVACKAVANMIKGKTVEEIHRIYNI